VPSLLFLHSTLRNSAADSGHHIIYWKTYMPPWHLLGVSWDDVSPGKISFTDLSGASQDELITALSASSFNVTHLVTPVSMYSTLPKSISSRIALERQIFPHLDLDHVAESIQAGGYEGLSLGVYTVQSKDNVDELAKEETLTL